MYTNLSTKFIGVITNRNITGLITLTQALSDDGQESGHDLSILKPVRRRPNHIQYRLMHGHTYNFI